MKGVQFTQKVVLTILGLLFFIVIYQLWDYFQSDSHPEAGKQKAEMQAITQVIEPDPPPPKPDPATLMDSSAQHLLLIGDSMAEGLAIPLQQYATFNGHRLTTLAQRSATIISWVGKDSLGRLRDSIATIRPSYVIICLGSNELFTKAIKTYRKYVNNIMAQTGPIPAIWVGPPNWKPDHGLTNMMSEELGFDQYFPSDHLQLARAGDGIHPTWQSYKLWMGSIANWMMHKERHKIIMLHPVSSTEEEVL
ncbi:MAG: hypothetical protein AAFU64_06150 [Bacteroidota bacterium]